MKKSYIKEINDSIAEIEMMLKESMNFYNEETNDNDEIDDEYQEMKDNIESDEDFDNSKIVEDEKVLSYVDHIRKYALNGLSELCETPESEEYQMLKKIFQMCDKKPEKKEGMNESTRIFGISKENKNVLFETYIENTKDFNNFKNTLVKEAVLMGIKPSSIRLVSEKKIIH